MLASWFNRGLAFFAIVAGWHASASACLPPPDDWVPPSREERVRDAARNSDTIIYGEVTRGTYGGRRARVRVLHVYKGWAPPGEIIVMDEIGWGLDRPMCAGMFAPPPVPRGARGVIFFDADRPRLNFLNGNDVALAIRLGLIAAGPHDRAAARPR